MNAELIVARMRTWLLGLTVVSCLGTIVELALSGHYEEPTQWIPFALCSLGAVTAGAAYLRPRRTTLWALRGAMGLLAIGAGLGVWLHLIGNYEFEAEIRPTAEMGEILWNAIQGGSPLLAPGLLLVTATLALIATYAHPALTER